MGSKVFNHFYYYNYYNNNSNKLGRKEIKNAYIYWFSIFLILNHMDVPNPLQYISSNLEKKKKKYKSNIRKPELKSS
jgi:hypothetical protein